MSFPSNTEAIENEIPVNEMQSFLHKNPPKHKKLEQKSVDKLLLDNAKNILLLSVEEKIKRNKNLVGHKYYSIQNRLEKNCITLSRATNSTTLYDKNILNKNLERILEIKKKCLLDEKKIEDIVEQ